MPYAGYAPGEVSRRGSELYEREIRPKLSPADHGRFVVIDIESGDWEIDKRHVVASRRMLERRPNGVLFGIRVGSPAAYRFGASSGSGNP